MEFPKKFHGNLLKCIISLRIPKVSHGTFKTNPWGILETHDSLSIHMDFHERSREDPSDLSKLHDHPKDFQGFS